MLDMPLEVACAIAEQWGGFCFNPSYAGYASGSLSEPNRAISAVIVSILLMLDMPLEVFN